MPMSADQTTITLTVPLSAIGAALLEIAAEGIKNFGVKPSGDVKFSGTPAAVTTTVSETPKKRGRPAKAAAVVEADEDELDGDDFEADEEVEDADELDDESYEDEPVKVKKGASKAPAKAAAETVTLEAVIGEFQVYARKHSREKAKALLGKFKVSSVRDLDKKDYAAVLKALKA